MSDHENEQDIEGGHDGIPEGPEGAFRTVLGSVWRPLSPDGPPLLSAMELERATLVYLRGVYRDAAKRLAQLLTEGDVQALVNKALQTLDESIGGSVRG